MSKKSQEMKRALAAGQPVFGLLHGLASPQVAEFAALAGYDLIVIDAEHGPGDAMTHHAILQAVAAGGAASMLRIGSDDAGLIGKALDAGADALLVPGVHTVAQAAAIAKAALYSPRGARGNGTLVARASGYGLSARAYFSNGNDEVFVAVMIESLEGARNAGAMAALDGIDGVVVGVFDLTGDMGITAQFEHPEFVSVMAGIERDVLAQGKALGTVVYPGTTVTELMARGHRLITLGADTLLLGQAMSTQLAAARDAAGSTDPAGQTAAR